MRGLRLAVFGALACLVLVAAGAAPAAADAEAEVGRTFTSARSALLRHDGGAAIRLLSRATLSRVERMRTAAVSGETAGLSPAEQFGAMGLRQNVAPARLQHMDMGALANYALAQGWLGPSIIAGSGLGDVTVDGDRAFATLLVNGRPQIVPADFVREGGAWRIDLTRLLTLGDTLLQGTAAASGRPVEAVIADTLAKLQPHPPAAP